MGKLRTQLPGRQMNGTGSSNGSNHDLFIWYDTVDTSSYVQSDGFNGRQTRMRNRGCRTHGKRRIVRNVHFAGESTGGSSHGGGDGCFNAAALHTFGSGKLDTGADDSSGRRAALS